MSSISSRRVRVCDIEPTPWKNGGGMTRDIATGGVTEPGAGWGWRVSLAEVAQDGPFSSFPDTDRVIAVIDGAGMDLLRPNGSSIALEPFQPVRFAGEEALSGRLREGPVRDLNVMVRRSGYAAEMDFLRGACSTAWTLGAGDCFVILNLNGGLDVRVDAAPPLTLAVGEILIHEGQSSVKAALAADSAAAAIRIASRQRR